MMKSRNWLLEMVMDQELVISCTDRSWTLMDRDGAIGLRGGGDRPGRSVAAPTKKYGEEYGSG